MFERYKYRREYRQNLKKEKKKLASYQKSMRSRIKEESRNPETMLKGIPMNNNLIYESYTDEPLRTSGITIAVNSAKSASIKKRNGLQRIGITTLFSGKRKKVLRMQDYARMQHKLASHSRRKNFRSAMLTILSNPGLRSHYTGRILTSTFACITSFLLFYSIYEITTILSGRLFSIPIGWSGFHFIYYIHSGSVLYTRIALICIFGSGPIISLILAFLILNLLKRKQISMIFFRFSIVWGFIHGFNLFFGSFIVGILTSTEAVYASVWLFMSSVFGPSDFLIILVCLISMLIAGRLLTPWFIMASINVTDDPYMYRPILTLTDIVFPWLAGTLCLNLFTLHETFIPYTLKTLTPVILLIPLISRYSSYPFEKIRQLGWQK
jgi:hypothetical protein